jgi:hypothetical protein
MTTENESITLISPHHNKLGLLHCGVTQKIFLYSHARAETRWHFCLERQTKKGAVKKQKIKTQ